MESRIQDIIKNSESVFSKRQPLMSLWQNIADNFYPERADFTTKRVIGVDFASHLTTSYPLIARRELGNSFSAMLRPTETPWFSMKTVRDIDSHESREWLERAVITMRSAMYDRNSGFVRATKEGDNDFAAFGQCVISVELNADSNTLLYRCWHLRDVAWTEGYNHKIQDIYHKIKMSVREINSVFKGNISSKLKEILARDPNEEVYIMRAILDAKYYEGSSKKIKTPYMSVYFECDGGHILEEKPSWNQVYIIPRWQTVSGSQYAFSPSTVAALPDARLLQSMMLVLLEAGEKAVNPPLIATHDVLRSDVSLYAGDITYVDRDYDERTGDALRPINMGTNIPLGLDMANMTKQAIAEAFYLNKLNLPQPQSGTTAYEIGQRIQEYIRGALPLFEPLEAEYNGAICDITFDIMMRANAFGVDIPEELSAQPVQFQFISPLHDAIEKQKAMVFQQARGVIAETMALDPSASTILDASEALQDTLVALGVPAKWMRDKEEVASIKEQQAQAQQAQQQIQLMQQGAAAGEQIGKAGQALNAGGMM